MKLPPPKSFDEFEAETEAMLTRPADSRDAGRPKFKLEPFAGIAHAAKGAWLVKRLIPRHGVGLQFGSSQSFKTFVGLDIALHVAMGRDWAGRRVTQAPVVYIAAEGAAGVRGRIAGWKLHNREAPTDLPFHLIAGAPNLGVNPSLPASVVERALERDPAAAAAEYLGEFRTDVEAFIDRAVVEAAVVPGRHELPMVPDVHYFGFVDPSGGSQDSMTLAVAHREGDCCVLDCYREVRPPFSPQTVVADFAATLRAYGLYRVTGDRWGGEFVREQFREQGIDYAISERPKSDIYKELLPLMNSRRVELLESRTLVSQLCGLERRTARGGRDSIDHAPGQHDDVINAVAGALVCTTAGGITMFDVL